MKQCVLAAAVACLFGGGLAETGRADTMTENFTVTIGPPAATLGDNDNNFLVSVPQFNPANGTLTSVSFALTGSGTYSSNSVLPELDPSGLVQFSGGSTAFGFSVLHNTGAVTINLSGSASGAATLAGVTGTGSVMAGVDLFDNSFNPFADTFETDNGGLSGTLTYTFTPTVTTVPEPSSLTLLGIGGVGLVGYGWRKRRATA
jgi:PEP-CTERM motif